MNRRNHVVFGVAVLLLGLVALVWLFGLDGEQINRGLPDRKEGPKLTALRHLGFSLPRRKIAFKPAEREPGAFDPYEEWGTHKVIEYFVVPRVEFEDVLLVDALDVIREAYAEHGGKNLEFRIDGGSDSGHRLKFSAGGSLSSLLDLVAGVGGFDVDIGDGEVVFRRRPTGEARLVELPLDGRLVPMSGKAGDVADDPFGVRIEDQVGAQLTALFERYGIEFEGGAGIDVVPETGAWMINHSVDQIDRIRAVSNFLTDSPGKGQVLVRLEGLLDHSGERFEAFTISDRGGNDVGEGTLLAPSVVTSNGQRAKIEIVREAIYPTEFDEVGKPIAFDVRNVGLTVEIEPALVGLDRVILRGTVEHVTVGDQSLENLFEDSNTWPVQNFDATGMPTAREEDFKTHVAEFGGQLIDGDKAGFLAAEENGIQVQQFIKARRLLADGTFLLPE